MLKFSDKFVNKICSSENIVFFTGAGISAESGIPTFRGKDGIWNKFKPEELANVNSFLKNPDMVWEWYQYRRKIVSDASPNNAHKSIVDAEKYFNKIAVITQNVDNLHRRAGSKIIYELHGNIEKNFCIKCNKRYDFVHFEIENKVPLCNCGGLIRPDVVWFGELLPEDEFALSEKAAKDCDIFFIVGTSAVVYPAAYIPLTAKEHFKYLIEVNIEETEISSQVDISFLGKAGEILPQIINLVKEKKSFN